MKFKISGVYSLVLVLVAFSSLVSMFALTRIDSMIKQDLYGYGLRFSYEWAMPYWTMSSLVFVMGWANIIMACAFQFYVVLYGRKKEEVMAQKEVLKPETTQPPMELELGMQEEEEAQKPAEEPEEEPVMVVEEKREEAEPKEPTAPQQLMVCRICGAQNAIGTKFCRYCGSLLKPEEISPAIEEIGTRETPPPAPEMEQKPKKKRPKHKSRGAPRKRTKQN